MINLNRPILILLPLIFAALLCPVLVEAAPGDTTFFDIHWKKTKRSEAKYYRLQSKEGKLIGFADYFMANDQVYRTGMFLKKKKDGAWVYMTEAGKKWKVQNYEEGELNGMQYWYHPNGKVKETWMYDHGVPTPEHRFYDLEGELTQLPGAEANEPLEVNPKPLNLPEITEKIGYPRDALEALIEGKVVVGILIGENGEYLRHEIRREAHEVLTLAVEREIMGIRFLPGVRNGKPVKAWVSIPFDFRYAR